MASYEAQERFDVRGCDPKDKRKWNHDSFPHYEATKAGFIVHCSKGVTLPGIYTDERLASNAYRKYHGTCEQIKIAKKASKKKG